jgi:hypothetical protein
VVKRGLTNSDAFDSQYKGHYSVFMQGVLVNGQFLKRVGSWWVLTYSENEITIVASFSIM